MAIKHLFKITILIFFVLLTGCMEDSNEEANKLYVKATQEAKSMVIDSTTYSKAYKHYEIAKKLIDDILKKYPSSNIAVRLSSGEIKVYKFSLDKFISLEEKIEMFSKAEYYPFDCALLMANINTNIYEKVISIVTFARKRRELGDKSTILLLFQAQDITEKIKNKYDKGSALFTITGEYIERGDYKLALYLLDKITKIANSINDNVSKSILLSLVSGYYIELEKFNQAYKLFDTKNESDKESILAEVAKKFANNGEISKALHLVNNMKFSIFKSDVLAEVAKTYAKNKKYHKALQIVKKIKDKHIKISALAYIANVYRERGNKKLANDTLDKALSIEKKINDNYFKVSSLILIEKEYIKIGNIKLALYLLDRAQSICIYIKDRSGLILLSDIIEEYVNLGKFTKALKLTDTIKNKRNRSFALFRILKKYAEIGEYKKALEIIETFDDKKLLSEALSEIAFYYGKRQSSIIDSIDPIIDNENMIYLKKIVHKEMPMKRFWESVKNNDW